MQVVKIFLADYQLLVREGIKSLLQQDERFSIVGEADCSKNLMQALAESNAEVVVFDYDSEGCFDMANIKTMQKRFPKKRILVISSDLRKSVVQQVVEHGAKSFLTKQCDKNEVTEAILATAKNESFFCNKVLDILFDKKEESDKSCDPTTLTNREMEIIQLVVDGLKTNEISNKLHLSVHTVNTHRKNIMRKLNLKNPAELVRFAIYSSLVEQKV